MDSHWKKYSGYSQSKTNTWQPSFWGTLGSWGTSTFGSSWGLEMIRKFEKSLIFYLLVSFKFKFKNKIRNVEMMQIFLYVLWKICKLWMLRYFLIEWYWLKIALDIKLESIFEIIYISCKKKTTTQIIHLTNNHLKCTLFQLLSMTKMPPPFTKPPKPYNPSS